MYCATILAQLACCTIVIKSNSDMMHMVVVLNQRSRYGSDSHDKCQTSGSQHALAAPAQLTAVLQEAQTQILYISLYR